jgi:natural product precursor
MQPNFFQTYFMKKLNLLNLRKESIDQKKMSKLYGGAPNCDCAGGGSAESAVVLANGNTYRYCSCGNDGEISKSSVESMTANPA